MNRKGFFPAGASVLNTSKLIEDLAASPLLLKSMSLILQSM